MIQVKYNFSFPSIFRQFLCFPTMKIWNRPWFVTHFFVVAILPSESPWQVEVPNKNEVFSCTPQLTYYVYMPFTDLACTCILFTSSLSQLAIQRWSLCQHYYPISNKVATSNIVCKPAVMGIIQQSNAIGLTSLHKTFVDLSWRCNKLVSIRKASVLHESVTLWICT